MDGKEPAAIIGGASNGVCYENCSKMDSKEPPAVLGGVSNSACYENCLGHATFEGTPLSRVAPDDKSISNDKPEKQLEDEFRWKELFAEVQQRNESPSFVVHKLIRRDHLLEAQMEHCLENYIRRIMSPLRRRELEQAILRKVMEMDQESMNLLEGLVRMLPHYISDDQCLLWWKSTGFRKQIVKAVAQRYDMDPDQPDQQLALRLIRTIHAANIEANHVHTGSSACVPLPRNDVWSASDATTGSTGTYPNNDSSTFDAYFSTLSSH